MQLRADARDEPGGERASRERGRTDDDAGEERLPVEKIETLEQRRLAEIERNGGERVGGEHRRAGEAGAEEERYQDHAGAGRDAAREAEDSGTEGEAGRA